MRKVAKNWVYQKIFCTKFKDVNFIFEFSFIINLSTRVNLFFQSVKLPKTLFIKKCFLQNFKIPIPFSKFLSVINLNVHFNIFAKSVEVPKI